MIVVVIVFSITMHHCGHLKVAYICDDFVYHTRIGVFVLNTRPAESFWFIADVALKNFQGCVPQMIGCKPRSTSGMKRSVSYSCCILTLVDCSLLSFALVRRDYIGSVLLEVGSHFIQTMISQHDICV